MKTINYVSFIFSVCILGFTSCKKDSNNESYDVGNVTVEFENVVGNVHVDVFGNTNYTNNVGEQFTVTKLKYYITNVELLKEDGTYYKVPDSYYLIDESVSTAHKIVLSDIPGGIYKGLRYMVGVDSAKVVSGNHSGVLDTSNQMFWNVDSGYVNLKLEGISPSSPAIGNAITYHIGGYKSVINQNTLRTITLPFDASSPELIVDGTRQAEIHIIVNLLELFKSPTNINFATLPTVIGPGTNSMIVASNYADMFKFDHIHNGQ